MKQPRKLQRAEKELLTKNGLDPTEWRVHFADNVYLHIIPAGGKVQDIRILEKCPRSK